MPQMKKQYHAVLDLKIRGSASGFMYSDEDGAGVALSQADVWAKYTKVCVKVQDY